METVNTDCASKRIQANYSQRSQGFVNLSQQIYPYRQILRLCNTFSKSYIRNRLKLLIYSYRKAALNGLNGCEEAFTRKEGFDSPKAFSQRVVGKRGNFKENHVQTTRCAMFFFEVYRLDTPEHRHVFVFVLSEEKHGISLKLVSYRLVHTNNLLLVMSVVQFRLCCQV